MEKKKIICTFIVAMPFSPKPSFSLHFRSVFIVIKAISCTSILPLLWCCLCPNLFFLVIVEVFSLLLLCAISDLIFLIICQMFFQIYMHSFNLRNLIFYDFLGVILGTYLHLFEFLGFDQLRSCFVVYGKKIIDIGLVLFNKNHEQTFLSYAL